jgi:hypothetical protein
VDLERAQRITRLRSHGRCEGCFTSGLFLAAHHRQARGMGGVHSVAAQDANDPRNLLALCPPCHEETEHAETWRLTEEIGWRIPKWVDKPYSVPALLYTVNYVGQAWYLLGMEGEYQWIDPTQMPELEQATWTVLPENPMDLAVSPLHVSASHRRIAWSGQSTG